jgi:hypothetical protein
MPFSETKLAAFRLPVAIIDGLLMVKARDGTPQSEQVRRAILAWLRQQRWGLYQGAKTSAKCPVCGGVRLVAEHYFEAVHRVVGRAEAREPYWSTRCPSCKSRFNFDPQTGELEPIK